MIGNSEISGTSVFSSINRTEHSYAQLNHDFFSFSFLYLYLSILRSFLKEFLLVSCISLSLFFLFAHLGDWSTSAVKRIVSNICQPQRMTLGLTSTCVEKRLWLLTCINSKSHISKHIDQKSNWPQPIFCSFRQNDRCNLNNIRIFRNISTIRLLDIHFSRKSKLVMYTQFSFTNSTMFKIMLAKTI